MNEEEDINSNRNNYVTGVVIDSNNPVFRTSSDAQFINAENPIEASDVITVGDNQYLVPDASIYRDAITIQKKRNTIIVICSCAARTSSYTCIVSQYKVVIATC